MSGASFCPCLNKEDNYLVCCISRIPVIIISLLYQAHYFTIPPVPVQSKRSPYFLFISTGFFTTSTTWEALHCCYPNAKLLHHLLATQLVFLKPLIPSISYSMVLVKGCFLKCKSDDDIHLPPNTHNIHLLNVLSFPLCCRAMILIPNFAIKSSGGLTTSKHTHKQNLGLGLTSRSLD